MHNASEDSSTIALEHLSLIVIYDNNSYKQGLESAWGFSCLVRGTEKTILFDTGGNGSVLLANMAGLGIDPSEIDLVVLSHIHGDHVGGLGGILVTNPDVTVYLPQSFPESFQDSVKSYGARVIEVQEPLKICKSVYSTGELGTQIREQSLIIHTDEGLAVITGCAHPGIVEILRRTKDVIADDLLLAMGGFHLGSKNRGELETILSSFKELGLRYVGPCHCTGDAARELFRKEYGKGYIDVGVGKIINMKELK